ncbi:IclR family transcriptional regulator [Ramlibacter sp.]|uniref:IclR family transcriptional regulator n=1 Tax=Ramlibacter sp. TaxID=1917967 RepID=UPI003D0DE304
MAATGTRAHGAAAGAASPARPLVAPFARALALLGAWTPEDGWLGNRELATRTGLPASTVTRIAQCLVELNYLHYDADDRKYRLTPSVLALGYAALANSSVQRAARNQLQAFAESQRVHASLFSRDRLELVVLESCNGGAQDLRIPLHVGTRVAIGSSPVGWTLLAALPELERYYLMENIERRLPREWPRLRRRIGEAIAQVYESGWLTAAADWDERLGVAAAPVLVAGHAPFVLACVGTSEEISRTRVQRELGPRLLAAADEIAQASAAS